MSVIGVKRNAPSVSIEEQRVKRFGPECIGKDDSDMRTFQYIYEKLQLNQLCPMNDMCAETFLKNLLKLRGYQFEKKSAFKSPYKRDFFPYEIESYSKQLISAVGKNDITYLNDLCSKHEHILACNRFGESTLHLAARHSLAKVVQLIFKHEKLPVLIDDYGRSPMSDAMWAVCPNFSIIEYLLDYDPDLIFLTDVRGFTPLNYVREEHVYKLCLFFYSRREKYWPLKKNVNNETTEKI